MQRKENSESTVAALGAHQLPEKNQKRLLEKKVEIRRLNYQEQM